jgi:hypothetical protein
MTKILRFGTVAAAIAVVAIVSAAPAQAGCASNYFFSTWATDISQYSYLQFAAGADPATNIIGRYWQDGARATANEGTYDDVNWIKPFGGDEWYINGDLQYGGGGCPANFLNVVIQHNRGTSADILVLRANEEGARLPSYDLSSSTRLFVAQPIPRPRVTSSSRNGTSVNLNLQIDSAAGAAYGEDGAAAEITGYVVKSVSAGADPGRDAALYTTTLGTLAAPGTLAAAVDCTNTAQDQFVVLQLQFDGGQFSSDLVGAATRVECDPNLADPKFKMIDRKATKTPKIQGR